jgi:hypothetical protein
MDFKEQWLQIDAAPNQLTSVWLDDDKDLPYSDTNGLNIGGVLLLIPAQ